MGYWNRRTSLEKNLLVISIIGAVLSISLLVALVVVANNITKDDKDEETTTILSTTLLTTPQNTPETPTPPTEPTATTIIPPETSETCFTKACVQTAGNMLARMDETVDPCEDFYEFSCGNFLKETIIPDDKAAVNSFDNLEDEVRVQLRKIVEEPIKTDEIEPFKNVKNLYKSCMDSTAIETEGKEVILNLLEELGGFPLINTDWNLDDSWSWDKFVVDAKKKGFQPGTFFSFDVITDFKDSKKRTIEIDQPRFGLPRDFLVKKLDDPFVAAYHSYQIDMAVLLGADIDLANPQMRRALDFEIRLAEISKPAEERQDPEADYNKMTVEEAQTRFPVVNWLELFNGLLPEESKVTKDDTIVNFDVGFFDKLGEIIETAGKPAVANYAVWRVILGSVDYLPNVFRNRQQEFNKITTGKEVKTARWQECVDVTHDQYPHAFGSLYVQKYFQESSKTNVLEMIDYIKNEFRENLNSIDWMDDDTKAYANLKLDAMKSEIGYADEILNEEILTDFYKDFPDLESGKFFVTIQKLKAASMDRNYKKLRQPVDNSEWTTQLPPGIPMAYYYSLENAIKFPAAFIQSVYYSVDRPQYTNYGGVGMAIGHEITHGFDNQGSLFNADGNLENWWDESTKESFDRLTRCFVDQFRNYIEPDTGLTVNGINTLGENIADNGGVKYAYRGYQKWVEEHGEEPTLPGVNYTQNQLFWISIGQQWCAKYRQEEMRNKITTGIHAPDRFRVIGPIHNLEEFAKDFKCAERSPMNPVDKCVVW